LNTAAARKLMKHCEEASSLLGTLAHPIRLKILCLLIENQMTVTSLTEACEISQPSMSQFLARMKEDGLLDSKRDGQRIYYRISDGRLLKLLTAIKEVYCK
jgi:ArsR family transcriptional regulator